MNKVCRFCLVRVHSMMRKFKSVRVSFGSCTMRLDTRHCARHDKKTHRFCCPFWELNRMRRRKRTEQLFQLLILQSVRHDRYVGLVRSQFTPV